jgi:peptide/nickel transport system permease protein
MLRQELAAFRSAPHLMIVPGAAIAWTVLGCNLFGDGLRDRLDPARRAGPASTPSLRTADSDFGQFVS